MSIGLNALAGLAPIIPSFTLDDQNYLRLCANPTTRKIADFVNRYFGVIMGYGTYELLCLQAATTPFALPVGLMVSGCGLIGTAFDDNLASKRKFLYQMRVANAFNCAVQGTIAVITLGRPVYGAVRLLSAAISVYEIVKN